MFKARKFVRLVIVLAASFVVAHRILWDLVLVDAALFNWFHEYHVMYGVVFEVSILVPATALIFLMLMGIKEAFCFWRYPYYRDLKKSRRLFDVDPAMAVVRQRITLEKAVRALVPSEIQTEIGKDNDLFNYSKMLFANGYIPRKYEPMVHQIRMIGNRAAHEGEASLGDASQCDRWLKGFLIWFRKNGRHQGIAQHEGRVSV